MLVKLVTWNVNSIKARLPRVLAWLEANRPDVLCLQELKVVTEKFPADELREAGYEAAVFGEKTYNGVAILTREAPQDVRRGLGDGIRDPQARVVSATCSGVRIVSVYVPNGQQVGSKAYQYKLKWMGRLRQMLERDHKNTEDIAICGDFNVATDDKDVAKPDGWAKSVLFHPEIRQALTDFLAWGLTDVHRIHHPDGLGYSWWDYRGPMWRKNEGLKIDHIFATQSLAARCTASSIDRDERQGTKESIPSDHAPVIAEFRSSE